MEDGLAVLLEYLTGLLTRNPPKALVTLRRLIAYKPHLSRLEDCSSLVASSVLPQLAVYNPE